MNPFVAFLILFPLVVSVILASGAVVGLMKHGLRWDIISALIILVVIGGSLLVLLKRTFSTPLLEFPGSDQVDVSVRKKLTVFSLSVIYLALGLMAVLLIDVGSVRNWVGVVCFALGLLMCYSGISQLNPARTLQPEQSKESIASEVRILETSLSAFRKTRNYLLSSSILTAIFAVLLYKLMDGDRFFSIFDLFGSLFLLGTIVVWFVLNGISRQKKVIALRRQLQEK